jgi:phage-related protein
MLRREKYEKYVFLTVCHKYDTLITMDIATCTVYIGPCFTIEWYYTKDGKSDVYDYFLKTTQEQKRKFFMLVKRIGDSGKIFDKTKFKNEGDGVYAFKPQPDRYLSFFTSKKKIIVVNGFCKKTDKLPKNNKALALRLREDYYTRFNGGNDENNNV